MPRKSKMQTSNDLIRENYEWPMTAGQVAKLTGVTTRALQHYDEKGLLCPERSGEGVANNRKLYSPEDIDRLKQIVVLGSYGFELKDMPPILDGERSLTDALADRIEELRAQERYLQPVSYTHLRRSWWLASRRRPRGWRMYRRGCCRCSAPLP